jgi:phosphoribosyl 1,2-cyclic phosphodiesterase
MLVVRERLPTSAGLAMKNLVRVFVLGSGSSGNALLVESCGTRVLVEAGVGPKIAASRLLELGVELAPGELHGIVATHQHGDHFGHADKLASTFGAPLYVHGGIAVPAGRRRARRSEPEETASRGDSVEVAPPSSEVPPSAEALASSDAPPSSTTPPVSSGGAVAIEVSPPSQAAETGARRGRSRSDRGRVVEEAPPIDVRRYEIGRAFRIGALTISTVQVPHDATQVAIRVDDGLHALGLATDVGRVTQGLVSLLAECDAALVEANHCGEMLAFSDYPDVVKRRIGGGLGHLSNAQTAELAARLVGSRVARLWLGHLSRSNNTPARALEVVAERARRIDVEVISGAAPVALDVRATKPCQLGLPF